MEGALRLAVSLTCSLTYKLNSAGGIIAMLQEAASSLSTAVLRGVADVTASAVNCRLAVGAGVQAAAKLYAAFLCAAAD